MNSDLNDELNTDFDLCIVGGGINGVGIARDAAGRGLSVLLVEKDDLGQATSSRSGKLIHGGLRYLEYYEFRLVREALIEREVLLESAPHIIWPLRFVLPHSSDDRPAWLVRIGLFLYDHLGGRKRLPGTRVINLAQSLEGDSLKTDYKKAFEFSDCWVDDARLVVLNALDAAEKGADIRTHTKFITAKRTGNHWSIQLNNSEEKTESISARCLVNAAGPWVNRVIENASNVTSKRQVRLVKGSHIVVKKFWQGEHAYLIQNNDKRVIFINPYEGDNALIGTTDIPHNGNPDNAMIEATEIDYLLAAVNRYFLKQLTEKDIIDSFSGVRPLYDDKSENPSAVTRDYLFDVDSVQNQAPLLSIFGGKITTFRKLSEHALDKLTFFFPDMGKPWTLKSALPGGDINNSDFDSYVSDLSNQYPMLPGSLAYHYARLYGTRASHLLSGVNKLADLGTRFGECFYEKEARYLVEHEWARSSEDILKRRTKHGLHMSEVEIQAFSTWCENQFDQWPSGAIKTIQAKADR